MKISYAETDVPPDAKAAAFDKLSRLYKSGLLHDAFRLDLLIPGLAFPHRVFWLDPGAAKEGASLQASAEDRGWRFLLIDGSKPKAAVETWNEDGTWRISQVRSNAAAYRMAEALNAAAATADIGESELEPCFLWCGATRTAAIWLKDRKGGEGRVIPLPFARPPLKPYDVMDETQFMTVQKQLT
jgi:hypothetical protein